MVKRKQLKNLAYGIAGRFTSRNNDLNGYWALGILYSAAADAGTSTISLDILSQTAKPSFQYSSRLLTGLQKYMDDRLERLQLIGHVFAATIDIEFDVAAPPLRIVRRTPWGEPYVGKVTLTDDLGQERSALFGGCCGKHDPLREHRSTRTYAS